LFSRFRAKFCIIDKRSSLNCSDAHRKLFGLGVQGVTADLKRPVPTSMEYPDACAREYAEIAIGKLRQTSGMRSGWPPFIEQGLRLLVLEKSLRLAGC
jgi:hypothetical protein